MPFVKSEIVIKGEKQKIFDVIQDMASYPKFMKNLVIDANIWLSLYHFTKDNFEKFEALKVLLKDEINLIVPEQVSHEVLRNRDGKVKSAWDQFCNFNFQIPAFCQSYPEYTDFLRQFRQLKEKH